MTTKLVRGRPAGARAQRTWRMLIAAVLMVGLTSAGTFATEPGALGGPRTDEALIAQPAPGSPGSPDGEEEEARDGEDENDEPTAAERLERARAVGAAWATLTERDAAARSEALHTLARYPDIAFDAAVDRLAHPDERVRLVAMAIIVDNFDRVEARVDEMALPLARALDDASAAVVEQARALLRRISAEDGGEMLAQTEAALLAEFGYIPEGLAQMRFAARITDAVKVFAPWRTARHPRGRRVPDQYARIFDDRAELIDTFIEILEADPRSDAELLGLSRMLDVRISVVRALVDAGVREAIPAIRSLLSRLTGRTNLPQLFAAYPLADQAFSDRNAVAVVCALALAEFGEMPQVRTFLQTNGGAANNYPSHMQALICAVIHAELGNAPELAYVLRYLVKLDDAVGARNLGTDRRLLYYELAVACVVEAASEAARATDEPAGTGPGPGESTDGAGTDEEGSVADEREELMSPRRVERTAGRNNDQELSRWGGWGASPVPASTTFDLQPEPSLDRALDYLSLSLELGFADAAWMRLDTRLDALRELPRFEGFLRTLDRLYPPPTDDDGDGE